MLSNSRRPLCSAIAAFTLAESQARKVFKRDVHVRVLSVHCKARHCITGHFIRPKPENIPHRHHSYRHKSTKSSPDSRSRFPVIQIMASPGDTGWLQIGKFRVYPWALSGLESCIVVEAEHFKEPIAFDIGHAHRASVKCKNVFIT